MLHRHTRIRRRTHPSTIVASASERNTDNEMELQVEGSVLAWARKRGGVTSLNAARRLRLSESELLALESGGRVALKQSVLTRMATVYKLPYGSLFMPSPLPLNEPRQWRTLRGKPPKLTEET